MTERKRQNARCYIWFKNDFMVLYAENTHNLALNKWSNFGESAVCENKCFPDANGTGCVQDTKTDRCCQMFVSSPRLGNPGITDMLL